MTFFNTLRISAATAVCLTLATFADAQCSYRLELQDVFGDGWNGSFVTVQRGNAIDTFTLDGVNDSGDSLSVDIPVVANDSIKLRFTAGNFTAENYYRFFDADGTLIFSSGNIGTAPASGLVFSAKAACPTCPIPKKVVVDKVKAYTARVSWSAAGLPGPYLVYYKDTTATAAQFVIQTPDTIFTFPNLNENTVYRCSVARLCSNGTDTSSKTPAVQFKTFWQNDVGIVGIMPFTNCGLTNSEIITVKIKNFGVAPQSLIPIFFSVNGATAAISAPDDGFYTGVIGRDSVATFKFDAVANLGTPNAYVLKAWTVLDNDGVSANDTFKVIITSVPSFSTLPYFNNFENGSGGWRVDSSSSNSSWQLGAPNAAIINAAASGSQAWVTNLTGNYKSNEKSYLESPCFDFTSITQDPNISFSINYNSELPYDGMWLEGSKNGGTTWTKIGTPTTGVNWYNNFSPFGIGASWAGNSDGWKFALHPLTGFAGQDSCRFRFVFQSDFSGLREGFGLDNVAINKPFVKDILAAAARRLDVSECGSLQDTVRITIYNNGSAPQTGFNVRYRVNSGAVVTENVDTLTVPPQQSRVYTFQTSFNSSAFGDYAVKAWTSLVGEQNIQNDTAFFAFKNGRTTPFREDFESGTLPPGWSEATNDVAVGNFHNSPSFVVYDNLYSADKKFALASPLIGTIKTTDSLSFDYRYVKFSTGLDSTVLSPFDSLIVKISTDCGATYLPIYVIKKSNHIATTKMKNVRLPLAAYDNQAIKIQFYAVWGSGDYYLDIDNVNVFKNCVPITTSAVITGANSGQQNGKIILTVAGGAPNLTYNWSNGATTKDLISVAVGNYCVTITDGNDCKTTTCFVVPLVNDLRETDNVSLLQLLPNPSNGNSELQLAFRQSVKQLRVQLTDVSGRVLQTHQRRQTNNENILLPLEKYAAGLYFVHIWADGESHTEKLILVK